MTTSHAPGTSEACPPPTQTVLMNWLQHAFDTSGPDESPTAAQLELVEKLGHELVRRRLALPALVFLEMSRPLNTLSAQVLHFFAPILSMFTEPRAGDATQSSPPIPTDPLTPKPLAAHELLAQFLERSDSITLLSDRIEALEKAHLAATSTIDSRS